MILSDPCLQDCQLWSGYFRSKEYCQNWFKFWRRYLRERVATAITILRIWQDLLKFVNRPWILKIYVFNKCDIFKRINIENRFFNYDLKIIIEIYTVYKVHWKWLPSIILLHGILINHLIRAHGLQFVVNI